MPYTAAQLITFYTNIHAGLAPNGGQTALLNAYAAQNNAGALTDAATLQAVIDTADADSAVAIGSYEFFTGTAPSAAGLAFLVNSATNPNDLNDPYYQNFNQTNRYINFAANLGTGAGAGAAAFTAAYGPLTVAQTVDLAYEAIIGTTSAQAAGINVPAAKAYINSQLPYFTALANQNAPAGATAAQKDLLIKAEIVGYILSAAVQANIGTYSNAISALLADLAPDNSAILGADLLTNYAATVVTLTIQPETRVANVFNAPRGFTPGGTDQVNTLNDDDNLTGVGTNPTLNFTFVNDADTGDNYIVPTMANVQTVNVAFALDAAGTLDAEDSTGIKALNITRISGNSPFDGIVNLTSIPTLSITNSNAPSANVAFEFLQSTVAGAADATTLTLSNVNIGGTLYIEQTGPNVGVNVGLTDGIETLTVVSTGSANKVGTIEAEDLKTLTISGGQKLTLGTTGADVNGPALPGLIEATRYGQGLANVAGSLTVIDASALTASLDIALNTEANTTVDDTSGTPLNLKVTGGSANDTIRLLNGANPTVGATIDGGAGTDTLQVYSGDAVKVLGLTKGAYTNLENLDVRSGQDDAAVADAFTVDTSLFPQLATVTLRNEGMTLTGSTIPGTWTSVAEASTFTLTKMTATTAAGITILHGTTNNNAIASSTIVASLATDTASDTVGVTIKDGVNNDPRFNFTLTAGTALLGTNVVENITITDSDSESNAVLLTNWLAHTGTITLNGGQVGNYLDLDITANGMRKDLSGLAADGKGWVDPGAGAAERLVATSIAGGSFLGDIIVRVGNPAGGAGAQSIVTGSGNDTVIFDTLAQQSVACNALHDVEERFCRWLLTCRDRTNSNELQLTQEFLAMMLGVQRTTVTQVAGMLQASGLIRYQRGRVEIVDRAGLERRSCECYPVVRRHFESVTPAPAEDGPCAPS